MQFHTKNKIFAFAFIASFVLAVLTFSGVIDPGMEMIGFLPASVLWAMVVVGSFFVLASCGYYFLFKDWAKTIDAGEDEE